MLNSYGVSRQFLDYPLHRKASHLFFLRPHTECHSAVNMWRWNQFWPDNTAHIHPAWDKYSQQNACLAVNFLHIFLTNWIQLLHTFLLSALIVLLTTLQKIITITTGLNLMCTFLTYSNSLTGNLYYWTWITTSWYCLLGGYLPSYCVLYFDLLVNLFGACAVPISSSGPQGIHGRPLACKNVPTYLSAH